MLFCLNSLSLSVEEGEDNSRLSYDNHLCNHFDSTSITMAANAVAMRAAYERMGFSAEAATRITDVQDIDTPEELQFMTDSEVERLVKALRRPGGTIPDPNDPNNDIPDPGVNVSLRAETNLKLACYYLRHQVRISRPLIAGNITLANVRALRELRDSEEKHDDPDEVPTIDSRNWPKTFEAIDEYYRNVLGETGIPLSYVIRRTEAVPPAAADPPDNYTTPIMEMTERAPHTDANGVHLPVYLRDREKVWDLLARMCRQEECWTYIRSAQRARNGRAAYWQLYNHFLGPNNVDNMATEAETRLDKTIYTGEKKRWNFERYVRTHVEQHTILEGLTEFGYAGIDERSKVRRLVDGIKCTDLDSVKTRIMSDPALRQSFDQCVTLYKDFIKQRQPPGGPSVQIASVNTESGTGGGNRKIVEDRYYTKQEYQKLSYEQKRELRKIRESRGHKGKSKGDAKGKKQLKQTIAALKTATEAITTATSNKDQDSSTESDSDDSAGPNRDHPALSRTKQSKKKKRKVSAVRTMRLPARGVSLLSVSGDESRTEADSHADTFVVGKNALIVHDFNRPVNVVGYDESNGSVSNCRTVSAALAHDDPVSGEVVILMVHQAISIPTMENNLLCPMQLRMNDVAVSEIPKFLATDPDDRTHAITIPDKDGGDPYIIPFSLQGTTSYFPTRKPTVEEYEKAERIYELTYESPEWDPHSKLFSDQEEAMTDHRGQVVDDDRIERVQRRMLLAGVSTTSDSVFADDDCMRFGQALEMNQIVSSVTSYERRTGIDPKQLAQKWGIGLDAARRTINVTMQRGIRTVLHPSLSRRFRTNDRQMRYRRLPLELYSDTLITDVKSRRGNRYAQVFCAQNGWARAFPMAKKSDAHEALSLLFARDGVPPALIVDGSLEQTKGEFRRKARQADCHIKQIEPHSPWQNAAEGTIRELKRGAARKMVKTRAPKRLWDDCLELEAYIRSNTAHDIFQLRGDVPETVISGETSDISQFCEFGWYEWVFFRDTAVSYPDDREVLGRYLGPSIDVGPAMTAKILKENGQVVHRSTYRPLTQDEIDSREEQLVRDAFDKSVKEKLGPEAKRTDFDDDPDVETPTFDVYADGDDGEITRAPDAEEVTPEDLDNYIGAEVMLQKGDRVMSGTVRNRKREADGTLRGTRNQQPILDTRVYEVEFPDGEVAEYAANVIAENMYAQCDAEGNQFQLLEAISDHKSDGHAVQMADAYVEKNGRKYLRRTTKGWSLCVTWRDGSTSWERLADLKESYPIEVAEYAVAHGIDREPAFSWWVPYTIRKRNRIIAAVKSRYWKRTHKFGFRIPKTVKEAYEIDRENGNTLWQDAIEKEMAAVRVAFQFLEDGENPPPGFPANPINCHIVFDIKMEDFRRKARFVAGGHMTEAPPTLTYASVVSRETVRIALTMAALMDLSVKASDIQNAYLTTPCREKVWTVTGPEFGVDAGRRAIIVRALYGLKSAGSSFRLHLADCMAQMGYKACLADPDLWMRPMVRPSDGQKYYAYMLLYVDDCLLIHHDAENELRRLDKFFAMKKGSIGDPDIYLGAKLRKMTLANGVEAWAMSSSKYVDEAVRNVEVYLEKNLGGRKLVKRASSQFPTDYAPELDTTPELDADLCSFYQSQVGVLQWAVELGRIDIMAAVSALSSHRALPREGHLEALLHLFAHIKSRHNARMAFDPTYAEIDMSVFIQSDWTDFYGPVKEPIPPNAPEPRGKEVELRMFVDSDHAGDKLTRRSRTGFIIYMNMAPIQWFSKKQPTIETSVFGAEFVALKNGMEALRGLRYKLRMMGIEVEGPSYVYGDNMSVIHNTQRPESTLKKKSNSVCYHAVREAVAMGELLTGHVSTHENPADMLTKVLPGGMKRDHLIGLVLYDITDEQ